MKTAANRLVNAATAPIVAVGAVWYFVPACFEQGHDVAIGLSARLNSDDGE
jgi:hypothetical protein